MSDMLSAPEFKYTDRQVREDPELLTWAEGYVRLYGGDFEPLLSAKAEMRSAGRLSTRTARVVLNCARYDQHFTGQLPDPKPPTLELVKNVAKLGPFCADPRPHYQHSGWSADSRRKWMTCPGIPWEINRNGFVTNAVVKAGFATAHNSPIYHRTTGKGWQGWDPPAHAMGSARRRELIVDVVCLYPSILRNPLLYKEEPTTLLSSIKKRPGYRTRCPNGCFTDE
jgi:hypothetical protein